MNWDTLWLTCQKEQIHLLWFLYNAKVGNVVLWIVLDWASCQTRQGLAVAMDHGNCSRAKVWRTASFPHQFICQQAMIIYLFTMFGFIPSFSTRKVAHRVQKLLKMPWNRTVKIWEILHLPLFLIPRTCSRSTPHSSPNIFSTAFMKYLVYSQGIP